MLLLRIIHTQLQITKFHTNWHQRKIGQMLQFYQGLGNKAWFNLKPDDCNTLSVDLDTVSQWQLSLEQVNVKIAPISQHSNENVLNTKQIELENWKSFNAYSEIADEGQSWITTTWVVTEKEVNRKKTFLKNWD